MNKKKIFDFLLSIFTIVYLVCFYAIETIIEYVKFLVFKLGATREMSVERGDYS